MHDARVMSLRQLPQFLQSQSKFCGARPGRSVAPDQALRDEPRALAINVYLTQHHPRLVCGFAPIACNAISPVMIRDPSALTQFDVDGGKPIDLNAELFGLLRQPAVLS
jgi:hypothetical protein